MPDDLRSISDKKGLSYLDPMLSALFEKINILHHSESL